MIQKQDILERAAEWRLRPDVVEKDYVLGWLLAALARSAQQRSGWVFKGGTCIKKCYFETYRFSEDLDFSLLPGAHYTQDAIRGALLGLTRGAAEMAGITFPEELIEVQQRQNKQGQTTFLGKISYRGPLLQINTQTPPRVLFDISQQEPLFDIPTERKILHPYPDGIPADATILAYSLDELLAEKTRALYERTRPRDLYDVVYILDNPPNGLQLAHVHELFVQKCGVKKLAIPSLQALLGVVQQDEELRSEWLNMLGHQLPELPRLDDLIARLPQLIAWIEQPTAVSPEVALPAVAVAAGESSIVAPGIRFWGSGLPLETIRFAGANRLLVEFSYHNRHRVAEPYSLRRAGTGNLLLYGWEIASGQVKAFKVQEMVNVRSTGTTFSPRYRIELAAQGPLNISPVPQRSPASYTWRTPPRPVKRSGPTYVFRCPSCGKEFRHSSNDSALRKHKTQYGWDCPSRRGYLVRTTY